MKAHQFPVYDGDDIERFVTLCPGYIVRFTPDEDRAIGKIEAVVRHVHLKKEKLAYCCVERKDGISGSGCIHSWYLLPEYNAQDIEVIGIEDEKGTENGTGENRGQS